MVRFWEDDRPYDGVDMVQGSPFVNPWVARREAACGLLQAQRQTFHGEMANLSGKAHAPSGRRPLRVLDYPKRRHIRVKNILFPIYSHLEIFKKIFIKIFQDFFLYAELNFIEVH